MSYRPARRSSSAAHVKLAWRHTATVEGLHLHEYSSRALLGDCLTVVSSSQDHKPDGILWCLGKSKATNITKDSISSLSIEVDIEPSVGVKEFSLILRDGSSFPLLVLDKRNLNLKLVDTQAINKVVNYFCHGATKLKMSSDLQNISLQMNGEQSKSVGIHSEDLHGSLTGSLTRWCFGMASKHLLQSLLPRRSEFKELFQTIFKQELETERYHSIKINSLVGQVPKNPTDWEHWEQIQTSLRWKINFLNVILNVFTGFNPILRLQTSEKAVSDYRVYRSKLCQCIDDIWFTENPNCRESQSWAVTSLKNYATHLSPNIVTMFANILDCNNPEKNFVEIVSKYEWFLYSLWQQIIFAATMFANFDRTHRCRRIIWGKLKSFLKFEHSLTSRAFKLISSPKYVIGIQSYQILAWRTNGEVSSAQTTQQTPKVLETPSYSIK